MEGFSAYAYSGFGDQGQAYKDGGDMQRMDDNWQRSGGRRQRRGGKRDDDPKQNSRGPPCSKTDPMGKILKYWKRFLSTFIDCGNAISTIECSLLSAKLTFIKLSFSTQELFQGQNFHVFSGCLFMYKVSEDSSEEEILLGYGLGRNKKSVKQEAYQKAHKRLLKATVEEILSQEALSDCTLVDELMSLFEDDAYGYLDFLKEYGIDGEEGLQALILPPKKIPPTEGSAQTLPPQQEIGSQEVASAAMSCDMGSWRKLEEAHSSNMATLTSSSLPEDQKDMALPAVHPLSGKLTHLKKLLMEKGITRLHMIPKIDTFGNEVGLDIKNVFRFFHIPADGKESEEPVYCELYFDNLFISSGNVSIKPIVAMHSAYSTFTERLFKEPLASIVQTSRCWEDHMVSDRNVCRMILKQKRSEDEDPMPTSNLADIQQMMGSKPDISKSIDEFVIFENETMISGKNSYAVLQESASRNCMLLECSMVRSKDQGFTCMLSIQGEPLSIRTSYTQTEAKRLASDAILARLHRTSDIVFVTKNLKGPIITKNELLQEAQKARRAGIQPLKCDLKREHGRARPEEKGMSTEIGLQAEHSMDSELIPWMGRVLADKILDYLTRFSLEDFQLHLQDMPDSMKYMAFTVSKKFGLRLTSREDALLNRCLPAVEVTKLLHVNNGLSGRFRLEQCKNPWSAKELQKYRNEVTNKYTKIFNDLLNDTVADKESDIEMETEYDIWYRESAL